MAIEELNATTLFERMAAIGEEAGKQIIAIRAYEDLTEEARKRRVYQIEQAARQQQDAARQTWETKVTAAENAALADAKPGREVNSELYQLGYNNGLLLLNALRLNADTDILQREFEQVLQRGVAGEVTAWAQALPAVLDDIGRQAGLTGNGTKARMAAIAAKQRCAEALEQVKPPRQAKAEATLKHLKAQRQQVDTEAYLSRNANLRQRVARLRGLIK